MTVVGADGTRIEQVLHGYQGGHRRIAGSIEFDDASDSTMLVLSDLLTSNPANSNSYYLTGYPLRAAHKYILARTWPADEIARPGCVWTHSLVLDYGTVAKLSNPSRLLKLFRRPHPPQLAAFNAPLLAHANLFDDVDDSDEQQGTLDLERAAIVLRTLYGDTLKREIVLNRTDPERDESLALAIWRQMWPRLRRTFLFATCVSGKITSVDADFYLLITPDRPPGDHPWSSIEPITILGPTLGFDILLNDLARTERTHLRQFLSRYSSDARDQRRVAAALAEIHGALAIARHREALSGAASILRDLLGGDDDCRLLKSDFLLGRLHSTSAGVDQIDAFLAMLEVFHDSPSFVDADLLATHVAAIYPHRNSTLPQMLDYASRSSPGDLGDVVITAVASALPLDDVVNVNCPPAIKVRLALVNRKLLAHPRFWPKSVQDRLTILSDVRWTKEDLPQLVEGLLPRITRDEVWRLLSREGSLAAIVILRKLARLEPIPTDEMDGIAEMLQFPADLRSALVEASPLPLWLVSNLAEQIEASNQENAITWRAWISVALKGTWGDRLTTQYTLAGLLFKAALDAPAESAFVLFQLSFDSLHTAAADGRLPVRMRTRLEKHLPSIGYFNDWDLCGRLRAAVIEKYLDLPSGSSSLLSVTSDHGVLSTILRGIGRTHRGRKMLEELLEQHTLGGKAATGDVSRVRLVEDAIASSRSFSWW